MVQQLFQGLSEEMVSKIHFVDQGDDFDWGNIDRGMLSVNAGWSGYSLVIGKVILNFMSECKAEDFAIYLVDIDRLSFQKQIEVFGTVCRGYFESIWVENGSIEFVYLDNNQAAETAKFKRFLATKLY